MSVSRPLIPVISVLTKCYITGYEIVKWVRWVLYAYSSHENTHDSAAYIRSRNPEDDSITSLMQ
jgi:hypothetical protein